MWYKEPQYLADIEEHLGVTIQRVQLIPGGGGGGQTVNTEDGYRNVRSMTPATLGRGGGGCSVGVEGEPVAGGGSSHI